MWRINAPPKLLQSIRPNKPIRLTTEQANEIRANLVLKYARPETEAKEQFANEQFKRLREKYMQQRPS